MEKSELYDYIKDLSINYFKELQKEFNVENDIIECNFRILPYQKIYEQIYYNKNKHYKTPKFFMFGVPLIVNYKYIFTDLSSELLFEYVIYFPEENLNKNINDYSDEELSIILKLIKLIIRHEYGHFIDFYNDIIYNGINYAYDKYIYNCKCYPINIKNVKKKILKVPCKFKYISYIKEYFNIPRENRANIYGKINMPELFYIYSKYEKILNKYRIR